MPRALGITITAVIVTILRSYVSAQTPNCLSGYTAFYNSLNQSPCNMTITLGEAGTCSFLYLPTLATGKPYSGPEPNGANSCQCSTVVYSLESACALCQDGMILPWSSYASNCPPGMTSMSSFPDPIPPSTKIPHWAYQDVLAANMFDPGEAEMAGGLESSAFPPTASSTPATTSSTQPAPSFTQPATGSTQPATGSTQPATGSTQSTTSSTQTTGSSAPIVSPSSSGTKSKPNVGAIAGGVIAGVFLGIVASLLVTFIILRRRKPSDPSPSTSNSAALDGLCESGESG